MEITDLIDIQAEDAEAALALVKQKIDPRVLGGPIKIQVLEIEPETDTSVTQ